MIFQLKRVFERDGEQMDFDADIPLEELGESVGALDFTAPISLKGRISNVAGMVSLSYSVSTEILLVCDRCLDEFTEDCSRSFEHILVREEKDLVGEDDVLCEDDSLDMTGLCVSDILMGLPSKILCSEDCLGLCPDCGGNLNRGECKCVKEND